MKIENYKSNNWFYNYYVDSKTDFRICHGLDNSEWVGIGYWYHSERKGFCLKNKKFVFI